MSGAGGWEPMDQRTALTRRDLLRLGAVAGGVALAGALVGCDGGRSGDGKRSASSDPEKKVRQQKGVDQATPARVLSGAPPVVDRLAVWSIIDNAHDVFLKSGSVGDPALKCEVQRNGLGLGQKLKTQLRSEFGLGFHLESTRGGETRTCLLDYGLSQSATLDNMASLGIDPAKVDALILSHGHYDHFGGLVPLLARYRREMRQDLPLYVGGEDAFCYRWFEPPGVERQSFGVLDRRDLDKAKVRVVLAEKPMVIGEHAFTTGPVPRTSFETAQPAAKVELGERDGAGCDASHFTPQEQAGQIVPDQFWFEHATCFQVRDRGLVVISSCGHAGIVNTVKAAQAVSGVDKVHAVMGGFHLAPAPEPYVAQTVDALREIDPDYVVPMHCSGRTFSRLAEAAMPGKVIPPSTGSRFVFGVA